VYPPSRILRGVALHCRRMPVVLLNSRIVGDPEVSQKRASRRSLHRSTQHNDLKVFYALKSGLGAG
jgi:hypothetical protein